MAFMPTRSGKGVGLIIPTLLAWPGSSVTLDIKGENWALTAAPTVLLAHAEQDVAAHRNGTAQASQGARLFGGTGISTAREAVTDTLRRDY